MTGQRALVYAGLDQWDPVFAVPGVHFVNLQYDDCVEEIAEVERRCGVAIHRCVEIDLMSDLDDAAALTSAVDLVVSAPNSVAFVAGALGKAVWVPVPSEVWTMLGTAGCPWCPSMRMFPRGDEADWRTPMTQISSELTALTARRRNGNYQP